MEKSSRYGPKLVELEAENKRTLSSSQEELITNRLGEEWVVVSNYVAGVRRQNVIVGRDVDARDFIWGVLESITSQDSASISSLGKAVRLWKKMNILPARQK